MIKRITLCILILMQTTYSLAGINQKQAKSVDIFMQKLIHAYETRDLNKIMSCYDNNAFVIGTGKNEVALGRNAVAAAYKKDFSQSTHATLHYKLLNVDTKNNIALVSALIDVNVTLPNNNPFQSTLRFTAALLKEKNNWVILQSHFSAPLAGQKESDAFPKS